MVSYEGGAHSIFFATKDIDGTIRFYRDLLGFRLYLTQGDPSGQFKLYLFEVNDSLSLAFFYWPTVEKGIFKQPGAPVRGPWNFDHLMIGVDTENSLFELRDKFLMAGVEVSEVIDHGFVYCIYAHDTVNNISLEFSYTVYNPRGMPMFNDPAPTSAAEEGAYPQKGFWPDVIDPTPKGQRRVLPGAGWDMIPADMKTADVKVELPEQPDE